MSDLMSPEEYLKTRNLTENQVKDFNRLLRQPWPEHPAGLVTVNIIMPDVADKYFGIN